MARSILVSYLDEFVVAAKRLGRHVEHDSDSWLYEFDTSPISGVKSVKHERLVPVFDQGNVGSCTGNAAAGALGTAPFDPSTSSLSLSNAVADEQVALALYSGATANDGISGTYPPNDTGSTGVAVAKAAQKAGYIAGYQHTFTLTTALKALQVTPVIAGVGWVEGFDNPNAHGLVKLTGQERGGHEFVIDEVDAENFLVGATNSWGTSYGVNGRFYFSWDTFGQLLANKGDVTVFVPVTSPAPTPKPTPVPTPAPADLDKAFWTQAQTWAKAKGLA